MQHNVWKRAAISATAVALALGLAPQSVAAEGAAPALAWSPCTEQPLAGAGMECATLTVPEMRDKPNGATVTLALVRHLSTGTAQQRIGSLVFNPGGPGGSGVDAIVNVWPLLPAEIQQRFDLVSWDPRGVGRTTPHVDPSQCPTPYPDRPLSGPVDWAKVARAFAEELGRANSACESSYAGDSRSISTMQNVADLESIRIALGEQRLTYWGMSYGTRIGYVYALLHPEHLRALVLDGSIDPSGTLLSLTEGGAGPDQAFGAFAAAHPDAARGLDELQSRLATGPVEVADGVILDRWTMLDIVFGNIGQQVLYPGLAKVIGMLHQAVFGTGPAQVAAAAGTADLLAAQAKAPNSSAGGVFSITNCVDYADRPSMAQVDAAVREIRRHAPRYGPSLSLSFGLTCSGLDVQPDPIPRITGPGPTLPVLILGSSRDAATVVQWTARMSRAFPQSRTVTYAGGQHVTWGFAGSSCVNAVANAFVIDGTLPAMDVGCPNAVSTSQS